MGKQTPCNFICQLQYLVGMYASTSHGVCQIRTLLWCNRNYACCRPMKTSDVILPKNLWLASERVNREANYHGVNMAGYCLISPSSISHFLVLLDC